MEGSCSGSQKHVEENILPCRVSGPKLMWKVLIMEPTIEKGFVARHVKDERNTWLPYTSNIQQEVHALGLMFSEKRDHHMHRRLWWSRTNVKGPDNGTSNKEECCCSHVMRLKQLGDGNLFSCSAHKLKERTSILGWTQRNKTSTRLGNNTRARIPSR